MDAIVLGANRSTPDPEGGLPFPRQTFALQACMRMDNNRIEYYEYFHAKYLRK